MSYISILEQADLLRKRRREEPMQLANFPNLLRLVQRVIGEDDFTGTEVNNVPSEWEGRFTLAERAATTIRNHALNEFVPQDVLEDEFEDRCSPDDDIGETIVNGDEDVVTRLFEELGPEGKALNEVVDQAFDGELRHLFCNE